MGRGKTQNKRLKRPDGRAINSKIREKTRKQKEKYESVSELRVTRVAGKEKKNREINIAAMPLKKTIVKETPEKRQLRVLKNKLREIERLLKYQEEGESLNDDQLALIDKLDDTIEQFTELSAIVDSQRLSNFQTISGGRPDAASKRRAARGYPLGEGGEEEDGYYNNEVEESDSSEN